MPVHKDCANFSNGFCSLYGMPVDPNGQACANFVPKAQQAQPAQPAQVPPPVPQPVLGMGKRFRRRRRARRRRGRGWLRIWPF